MGFSRKIGYKKAVSPDLGISSKIKVQCRAAVVLVLGFEYQHQLMIARRLLEEETGDPVAQLFKRWPDCPGIETRLR